jgi:putative PIN family toxin of toxin-antitoxin system
MVHNAILSTIKLHLSYHNPCSRQKEKPCHFCLLPSIFYLPNNGYCYIIYDMIKMVIDTNVLLSGLISRHGASNRLLQMIGGNDCLMLVSVPLFLEYESVLKRPEMLLRHGFPPDSLDRFLAFWANNSRPVTLHVLWRPQLSDPNDEMVLETAVNGGADCIVTFNTKDFEPAAAKFGIKLFTPAEILRIMEVTT